MNQMEINFSKYHGAGNDFIMIDGRTLSRQLTSGEVAFLCHRYFGVGADGLIIIQPASDRDYKMIYYNADGGTGMMCANGSRCAVKYANAIGYPGKNARFSCCDVPYTGQMYGPELVGTEFPDLRKGKQIEQGYCVDTGAPHLVIFEAIMNGVDPRETGRYWRYHEDFAPNGTNVNFIEVVDDNELEIVTYERGVEDLTLACGTGALASAIAFADLNDRFGQLEIALQSDGGTLVISSDRVGDDFTNIEVKGPAVEVFSASIEVQKLSNN